MASNPEPRAVSLLGSGLHPPIPSSQDPDQGKATTLDYVLENIQDGYYEVDLSGNFERFNEAMRGMVGYPAQELMGMNYITYIDPEDTDKVFKVFHEVYKTGVPSQAFDWRIIRKDGTVRYIETSVSLKKNKGGQPKGFMGIARDATQAKLNDKALRDSESRYRSFLEASPDPIVIYDMEGLTQYVNHAFEKTFGWTPAELTGKRIDFVPAEHLQETLRAIQELKKGNVVKLFETQRLTKKGERLAVQLSSATYLNAFGQQTGIIVILRDISELKRTRIALAESESKFSTLTEESPYGISLIDRNGIYQYLNRKFIEIFGYTLQDIPNGRAWFRCAFPDSSERKRAISVWKSEHQVWMPGESKPYIRKVACKNGHQKVICFRPVVMPNGDFFISYEDITERETAKKKLVQAHRELEKAHESLQSIERIKEKAIDHISHELKTPIAILEAVFRILRKSSEHDSLATSFDVIERGQRYLQRLKNIQLQMNDIVLYRKDREQSGPTDLIEDLKWIQQSIFEKNLPVENVLYHLIDSIVSVYGRYDQITEKFDLSDLVHSELLNLQASCSPRNMRILEKTRHGISIHADKEIIGKVISGLLKNAIENTPDGGMIILKTKETPSEVGFEILDFGVGITEENQKNLFWGFFHTQDTKHYSTKKPCEFNAGGCGADLLRMKLFANRLGFRLTFTSRRCKYISLEEQACPGSIAKCHFVRSGKECMQSGGSQFRVVFPKEKFSNEPLP